MPQVRTNWCLKKKWCSKAYLSSTILHSKNTRELFYMALSNNSSLWVKEKYLEIDGTKLSTTEKTAAEKKTYAVNTSWIDCNKVKVSVQVGQVYFCKALFPWTH